MNILKDWKAKLDSAYSFMLKYYEMGKWEMMLELSPLSLQHVAHSS